MAPLLASRAGPKLLYKHHKIAFFFNSVRPKHHINCKSAPCAQNGHYFREPLCLLRAECSVFSSIFVSSLAAKRQPRCTSLLKL